MFYYLNGKIALLDANLAVVDCAGVGYACHTSNVTMAQLRVGETAKLFTYCNIKEDAFDIYGFATRDELRCFEQLLGVTGVGPKAALAILSVLTSDQLTLAVATGNEKMLVAAQGVGKKMAQRILLELKDKISGELSASAGSGVIPVGDIGPQGGGKTQLAIAALQELGYSQSEAASALKGADSSLEVNELVRYALRAMVMR